MLLAAPHAARAQGEPVAAPISTDRPTEGLGAGTVSAGTFQFETGWKLARAEGGGERLATHSFPDLLARVGIVDWLEARFTMNGWNVQDRTEVAAHAAASGFSDVSLGMKATLAAEQGWRPKVGLLVDVSVPVGDAAFSNNTVIPKVLMLFQNGLSDRLGLIYNIGTSVGQREVDDGGERTVVNPHYVATLTAAMTPRTSAFVEFFGNTPLETEGVDTYTVQGGVVARVSNNTQFDARVGVGLVEAADDWVVGAGFSFRLPR